MTALSTIKKPLELQAISEGFKTAFLHEVQSAYRKYADSAKFPVLPYCFFHGEQNFIDSFIDVFTILRASYIDEHYPNFNWDDATDDERDTMDEAVSVEYISEESDLMEDIGTAFDYFQLFHLEADEVMTHSGIQIIMHPHHSPLQEVW